MHTGITAHPVYLDQTNLSLLDGSTFVFLAAADAEARPAIMAWLTDRQVPFIDVGMGIEEADGRLSGLLRITTHFPEHPTEAAPTPTPVERGLRRHRGRVAAVHLGEDLLHPPTQPAHRAGGPVGLLGHRLADRVDQPRIGAAQRRRRPGQPRVHQTPQPLGLIPLPGPLQRAQRDLLARLGQLGDLGDLPLAQRPDGRVVLRLGHRAAFVLRRQTGKHLHEMPLPPQGLPGRLRRHSVSSADDVRAARFGVRVTIPNPGSANSRPTGTCDTAPATSAKQTFPLTKPMTV